MVRPTFLGGQKCQILQGDCAAQSLARRVGQSSVGWSCELYEAEGEWISSECVQLCSRLPPKLEDLQNIPKAWNILKWKDL